MIPLRPSILGKQREIASGILLNESHPGVIFRRNRQRNSNATPSCVAPLQTPLEAQPSCFVAFARLVQAYGTSRGFLFELDTIAAELDEDDVKDLEHLERHHKQSWATMLAHRMAEERLARWSHPAAGAEQTPPPGRHSEDTTTNEQ